MSTPATARAGSRLLAPRDWSLRVKLAVVLLVPGILAAVLGVLRVTSQAGEAAELDRVTRFATAQGEVATLVQRMQDERIAAAAFVAGGRTGDSAPLDRAVGATDQAAAATTADVEALYEDDPTLTGAHRQAEQALARLDPLRALVRSSNAAATATTTRYSDLVGDVIQLDDALLRGLNTDTVNGLATALSGLAAARDEASLQLALVTATGTGPAAALAGPLQESDARLATGLEDFRGALDLGQRVRYAALIAGPSNTAREALVQQVVANGAAPDAALERNVTAGVGRAYPAFLGDLDQAQTAVRAELTSVGTDQRSGAVTAAVLNAILLLLALLIGAAVVVLLAREMLTSLRTLRTSALDVAHVRLPAAVARMREGGIPDVDVHPVPVRSQEEIGEVARAFDAVHEQAVRLAAEQATLQSTVNSMFVNMSRRSQSLVDKQLQLIEELEKGEQDADQLANLFRLDHLATRMRRNSENLLVLAGTDLSKRANHRVPIVDVLRAAVSETEAYERITMEQAPAVAVAGRAASDLQHLIAELLDNATTFSSPGTPVVMSAIAAPGGALIVEIVDHGVGMPATDLAAANALLGRRTEVSVTASRRMGLFVVARLAGRHGIVVRLVSGPPPSEGASPGLTARVTIPKNVVVTGPEAPRHRPHPVDAPAARPSGPPAFPTRPAAPSRPPALPGSDLPPQRVPAARPATPPPLPTRTPQHVRPPAPMPEPVRAGSDRLDAAHAGRTPVFEEESTGWFRSYRQVPINWTEDPRTGEKPPAIVPRHSTSGLFSQPGDPAEFAFGDPAPTVRDESAATSPVTAQGLPRRTPGARLIPGTRGPGSGPGGVDMARDPDAVRDRLRGYQRGVRHGRDGGPAD